MNSADEWIIGINALREKLRSAPGEILEILVAAGKSPKSVSAIEQFARSHGIGMRYVGAGELDLLVPGQKHQGVVARTVAFAYASLSELENELKADPRPKRVLILDGITDPRNFGAILRTAEAAGVRHVLLPKDRSVRVSPAVVKSSAGAVSYLRICRVTNLRRTIAWLKQQGLWIVGLDAGAAEVYDQIAYPARLGIVLGGEGHGIRPLIARQCDYLVRIPMRGSISSLNVSVAAAVLLYELLSQEGAVDKPGGRGY